MSSSSRRPKMLGEQSLENLICKNRTLVNNCNALKKLIVAYENQSHDQQNSDEKYIRLDEGPIEHYYPPLHVDVDVEEMIEDLKIKNADLEIVTGTLFRKFQETETLLKNNEQDSDFLAPEELKDLPKTSNHEQRVDIEGDEIKASLHTKCQDLVQSIVDVQNQKKQLEKHNSINKTIIEQLNEENDALKEKVKQLEEDVQNLSPVSNRIAYFLMTKTNIEAKRKKYQEKLNFLLKERMKVEDMAEDLNEQLTRMKDFSNYINLIKELEKQVDDLQDSVKMIKHKKKKKQFSLFKKIWNFFLSESEIIKGNVNFLLRERQEVKTKADNLEKELTVVENILTVYSNIRDTHQNQLDDLRERMRKCEEALEKSRPSLCQRFLNLFRPGQSHCKDLIEMRKNKKHCKFLNKQLEVVQTILCTQEIIAEKLKTKISGLRERARMFDYNLLELNSLTLKNKKISRLYF